MNWIEVDVPTHPLKNAKWVKIIAHIKRVFDGEVRKSEENAVLDNGDKFPDPYIWEDGNYSCDCNRELFFECASGKSYDEVETECGDERFQVNLENPATGEIYYREFE
jgi:hypothetical protein